MNPHVDFHAIAPELVLTGTIVVVLLADLILRERQLVARLATLGTLASLIPVITLAVDGANRSMFRGVIDVRGLCRCAL